MVKIYFVRLNSKTPNKLSQSAEQAHRWQFSLGGNQAMFYEKEGLLFIDTYIEAEDISNAEMGAKNMVETYLCLMDLVTSAQSEPAKVISAYDATSGIAERESFQKIPSYNHKNSRTVPIDMFGEIFNAFNQMTDSRVMRAISWLRKGYLEDDAVNKFVAFWTGLESINELLADHFEIPESKRFKYCENCNEQSHPINIGTETLFLKGLCTTKEVFSKIRRARGKLLHGQGPVDVAFISQISEHVPLTKKALILGIGLLLNVDAALMQKIADQTEIKHQSDLWFLVKGKIIDFTPPNITEHEKQPYVKLSAHTLEGIEKDQKFTGELSRNITLKDIEIEVRGENVDGVQISSLSII